MIKKLTVLFAGSVLAIQFAGAQIETGTSSGAQALDRARSAPVAPNAAPEEEVVVVYDAKGVKEVFIEEVPEKMWSLNVSTGWDSLYMFRGANVLGNNNGLYWVGGDLGVSPWEGGSVSAGFWYAVGTSNPSNYQELNVFADDTLDACYKFKALINCHIVPDAVGLVDYSNFWSQFLLFQPVGSNWNVH